MALDLAATVGGAIKAYGTAGHGLFVIAVDRTSGTLTIGTTRNPATASPVNINDATNGIPTAAQGDFIFAQGDQGLKIQGIEGWIPYGGPSATLFNGVNRTTDPVRLAGQWLDARTLSIEDAFTQAATNVAKQGFDVDHFFVPYGKYAQLLKSQSAKVQIVEQQVTPQVSFKGVEVNTASGTVMVIPDRNCPPNRMYGLNLDSWSFIHTGDPVGIWDLDSLTAARQPADDGLEIRFYSFGNVACELPVANITMLVNP